MFRILFGRHSGAKPIISFSLKTTHFLRQVDVHRSCNLCVGAGVGAGPQEKAECGRQEGEESGEAWKQSHHYLYTRKGSNL